ncbi:hypothetical protein GCM10011425_39630 [Mucilaginibacter galii]|uniref:Uncharacterized protein n=1 Tax=Mucilaginibacter galii TaxID=2005073 RepID=A0A917JER9_9SPHI|nr:hypothetical protein GCM10011425_39630 [Mucilaginibacter galii]
MVTDEHGQPKFTYKESKDILGNVTKVVTDGQGKQILSVKGFTDIFGNDTNTVTTELDQDAVDSLMGFFIDK